MRQGSRSDEVDARWERWNTASMERVAYLTLAVSTAFAVLRPDREPGERLVTLALVALSAAWVYALFTRSPKPRTDHRARMLVYFTGLIVLASVLMTRNPMFFVFAITGFFHAALLRPCPSSSPA